ncbi:hypothetical protein FSP39_012734 [Pinctada imbricata]|uniref:Uncharacterized protein n=1 Tax=Pinctada imbricata TaxID=66713 RepID=A0AA89BKL9_PINIB|nr:hypothetical protein FSP39_012734 [Pinctada imbricata]
MFFFYIIVGVFSCLRRNLVSAAVGFYYLARLDKCILIPGLEQFDISYMAYVAFLRVQVSHSNPIVMTFCELLVRRINALQPNNTGQLSTVSIEDGKRNQKTKSLARRRWFKAVTLLRNPALICESKPQLLKKTVSNQGIEENIHVTHYENITVYENNAI